MPEHEPHPGQAQRSIFSISASLQRLSALMTMASIRSIPLPSKSPASIGPPDTKIVGIFRRIAAISMPGVILSQLLIQNKASTWWALAMYSTLSAMISREGSEYNIPSWPMAIPSSMAMVLNSAAKHPRSSIKVFTYCPISCRWVWPGTNWVNELTMPMTGIPNCSSFIPLALHKLLAPAIRRPVIVTALLRLFLIFFYFVQ